MVANIVDGFNHLRAAHRAQQHHDRRLPIEDMGSASAAAAPPESYSAAAAAAPKKSTAPRGRARTRAQSSNKTKEPTDGEREVAGQGRHA